MRFHPLVAVALVLVAGPVHALGAWRATTPLPVPVSGARAVAIGRSVYVFGGDSGEQGVDAVEYGEIDAEGNIGSWQNIGTLPQALAKMAVATDGTHIWIAGGELPGPTQNTIVGDVYVAMVQGPNITFSSAGEAGLPNATSSAGAVWDGKTLWIVGGAVPAGSSELIYSATPSATGDIPSWTISSTNLPIPRQDFGAGLFGGRLAAAGGFLTGSEGGTSVVSDFDTASVLPDGTLGTFATAGHFLTARYRFGSATDGSTFYVFGGYGDEASNYVGLASTEIGTATDATVSFAPGPTLPSARVDSAGVVAGNHVLCIGGRDPESSGRLSEVLVAAAAPPSTDGGTADAGVSATGSPDAGASDAGSARGPAGPSTGCGCGGGPDLSAFALLSALLAGWPRSRRARRRS